MTDLAFQAGPPHALVVVTSPDDFGALLARLSAAHPEAMIRQLRGTRCRTVAGFFEEAAAVFQFPHYFGRNWNAFDECFGELAGPGEPVVVGVFDGEQLLCEASPADLANLAIVVAGGNDPTPDGSSRTLKLVVQVEAASRRGLDARLDAAGFAAQEMRPDGS